MKLSIQPKDWSLLLVALTTFMPWAAAFGNATYSGNVSGTFSDPVLSGFAIDTDGSHLSSDNTTTAVFTGFGTNSITWGDFTASSLVFNGNSFAGVQPGQTFELGTLTYFNGASTLESLIFGATLTLSAITSPGPIDPGVAHLGMLNTANGTGSVKRDADFLTFDVFPVTFNVLEGASASAKLFGKIEGDPELQVTGIELAPGQDDNAFIGNGQPAVPDGGSTIVLLGVGLGGLGVIRRHVK
jgi:VPDSG-CTERM exosortase interaction domain